MGKLFFKEMDLAPQKHIHLAPIPYKSTDYLLSYDN